MTAPDLIPRPKGVLRVQVFDRGELVDEWEENNTICVGWRTIAPLLALGIGGDPITKIGFGIGQASPQFTDTALTSAYVRGLGAATRPVVGQLQLAWSLGTAEANGKAIAEYGLLSTGGVLVARKTRGTVLNKTSTMSLAGSWNIQF